MVSLDKVRRTEFSQPFRQIMAMLIALAAVGAASWFLYQPIRTSRYFERKDTMILKLAALGALGYAGYRYYEKNRVDKNGVAFADGEPEGQFRNAGSESTSSHDAMSSTDEALDETYPASDATAKY